MASAARNMLFLETILNMDLDETYVVMPALATERYLYYDYNTKHVHKLSVTDTLLAVTPRFSVATRTTLRECEVEVRQLLDGERLVWHATEEARVARLLAEKRG